MSLQRREQKGPKGAANQSPWRLQVGHLIPVLVFTQRNLRRCSSSPGTAGRFELGSLTSQEWSTSWFYVVFRRFNEACGSRFCGTTQFSHTFKSNERDRGAFDAFVHNFRRIIAGCVLESRGSRGGGSWA